MWRDWKKKTRSPRSCCTYPVVRRVEPNLPLVRGCSKPPSKRWRLGTMFHRDRHEGGRAGSQPKRRHGSRPSLSVARRCPHARHCRLTRAPTEPWCPQRPAARAKACTSSPACSRLQIHITKHHSPRTVLLRWTPGMRRESRSVRDGSAGILQMSATAKSSGSREPYDLQATLCADAKCFLYCT